MSKNFFLFLLSCLFFFLIFFTKAYSLEAENKKEEDLFAKGITVDLREPEFSEGILKTDKGGVITAPNMRLQARKIIYIRKIVDEKPVFTIEADGDLLIEFGEYIFVGDSLSYDFQEKKGIIRNGRSAIEPWFFGGEIIHLEADGYYTLKNAFITTSENSKMDWHIAAEEATLNSRHDLRAKNVQFRFFHLPLFWLPSFKTNLNTIFDAPIRYSFKWGGNQGPRGSLIYEFFSREHFKALFRFDWRLNRGIGIGIETYYQSEDHLVDLETINYIAQDSAIIHPSEQIRYRYQGVYNRIWDNRNLTVNVTWDKISDREMPTDYKDKGLELDTAGRTQLHIRHEKSFAISNFYTRVRVNSFQTIKQELPSFEIHFLPLNILKSNIISDCCFKASFLDFKYADSLINVHDYHSMRFEYSHQLYRAFHIFGFNIIPQVGGDVIFYNNSPQRNSKCVAFWNLQCEINSRWYRYYNKLKHVVLPYTIYNFISFPSTSPSQHYIFDINDGWYRLNMLTFGVDQNIYTQTCDGNLRRLVQMNIYAHAFFKTRTMPKVIPKIYSVFNFQTFSFLHHTIDTAWDFEKHRLDHFNIRLGWTISKNAAIAAEYRQRDAYDWRKADHTNFIIDSFRSIEQLRHSQLSDRRDTLLLHFYYRINPKWAIELESRHGWNRLREPKYNEFEIDLLATLQSACHLKFSYRYREEEKFRIAVNFNVGLRKPDASYYNNMIPCLEF